MDIYPHRRHKAEELVAAEGHTQLEKAGLGDRAILLEEIIADPLVDLAEEEVGELQVEILQHILGRREAKQLLLMEIQ